MAPGIPSQFRLNCGHKFCQACVAPCQDCLLCGEDITSRESDIELQGSVDAYMEAAGVCSRPGQAAEAAERVGGMDLKAAFWLQEGLRSLAGGNPAAALHRLLISHKQLEELTAGKGRGETRTAEAVQLGAVRGACGECCQQLGRPEAAAGHYEASAAHLMACPDPDQEVFQALAVSNSKLGDLHYTYGHLEPALGCYQAAVQIRQQAASNPLTQDTVQQHLNLAMSLAKVADLEQALGSQTGAASTAHRAQQELDELTARFELPPVMHAKAEKLRSVIATVLKPPSAVSQQI
ncbi:hypothetical protein WJX84_011740 [Apatococcus fuscideae]|uniref:Uncharacterized protein n=1 Tax=Apatococcus fuscideae TaxID=2026836 RepID=A0AAW1TB96_9CHLO